MVRSVIYLKPNYYIIGDSVHNTKKGKVECNFVSACPMDVEEKYIQYRGRKSHLYQFLLSSERIDINTRQLLDDRDNFVSGVSIETASDTDQVSYLNLLYPTDQRQPPFIKTNKDETGLSIQLISTSEDDLILQKSVQEKIVTIGDVQSDCEYIVLRKRDGNLFCIGFFQGTFLKIKDRKIIQTDKKTSLICYLLRNNVFGEAISSEETLVRFSMFNDQILLTLSETDETGYSSFASVR